MPLVTKAPNSQSLNSQGAPKIQSTRQSLLQKGASVDEKQNSYAPIEGAQELLKENKAVELTQIGEQINYQNLAARSTNSNPEFYVTEDSKTKPDNTLNPSYSAESLRQKAALKFEAELSKAEKGERADFKTPERIFNRVINYDPNLKLAHYNRGLCKMKLEDFEGAKKDFTQELELHEPGTVMFFYSHFDRGFANKELKEYEEALSDFEEVERAPAEMVHPNLITVATEQKLDLMHDLGGSLFKQAESIRTQPKPILPSPEDLKEMNLGFSKSVEYFREVIAANPKKPWVNFDCGMSLFRLNKFEEALESFGAEIPLHESGSGKYRSHYERGLILHRYMNDQLGAKSEFEAALANQGDSTDPLFDKLKDVYLALPKASQQPISPKVESRTSWVDVLVIYCAVGVALHAALFYEMSLQSRPEDDFRPEEEAEKAVRGFARNQLSFNTPNELLESLTNLDQERFLTVCQGIAQCKNQEEFQNFLARENIPAIDLNGNLQQDLVTLFAGLIGVCKTMPAGQLFSFPKNHLYDNILKEADSDSGPIDQARLDRFVTIFKEEAAKTLGAATNEMMAKQLVEEISDFAVNRSEERREDLRAPEGGDVEAARVPAVNVNAARAQEVVEGVDRNAPIRR